MTQLANADNILTDLKLDNVLFPFPYNKAQIEARLRMDGPPTIDREFEVSGKRYPIMRSQPFTHEFSWNSSPQMTELLSVYLTDFGHCVFCSSQKSMIVYDCLCSWSALKVDEVPTALEISPHALRAPEVILGAKFDTKVDVWALGCIVSLIQRFIIPCGLLQFCLDIRTSDRALAFWSGGLRRLESRRWSFGKNDGAYRREVQTISARTITISGCLLWCCRWVHLV